MRRALVLGGGGPVGFAWECGLVAGFAQGGADLGRADFVLGTSAGAITGARLAGGVPAAELAESVLDPASRLIAPPAGGSPEAFGRMMQLARAEDAARRNPAELRREIGALALTAETAAEDAFLEVIGRELGALPRAGWPACDYACAAVDAEDGGFQLWDASCGADLRAAVASSCSVPGLLPPITVNGRRYMDGGLRSPTNADLAAGYEIVVVVSVLSGGETLDQEIETLQAAGSTVVAITPDDASLAAFGGDMMDAERKPEAARAGLAQGLSQADVLKSLWGS